MWNLSRDTIEQLKSQMFYCPSCLTPVYIKNGLVKLPHFSHYKSTLCSTLFEGETQEHLELKKFFVQWCEQESIVYELEKYLPRLNQRPDILIGKIAIEIQCSILPVDQLMARTQNYRLHGYTPIWICGEKLLFQDGQKMSTLTKNISYYSEKIGFFIWGANQKNRELTLYFHIEEDWQQKSYYSKKYWKFFEHNLLDIFNYPHQAKLFSTRKYMIGHLQRNYYIHLNKEVIKKSKKIQLLQSILYKKHFHILHLPHWFYYPGILIFGCKHSDLLIKMVVWKAMIKLENQIINQKTLREYIYQVLVDYGDFFHPLPNISKKIFYNYCINKLVNHLVTCNHLILLNDQRYYIRKLISNIQTEVLYKAFQKINYPTLNSSVPMKNMIELISEK